MHNKIMKKSEISKKFNAFLHICIAQVNIICSLILNLNSHTDYQKHLIQFIFKDGYHFTTLFTQLYIALPICITKTCNQL